MRQQEPHVLLVVSGGIAAYKACEVLRALQKAGCVVRVAMTHAATRFVGPTTFSALTDAPVLVDLFEDASESGPIGHIALSAWADLALVVPATANLIAKMATGIADDAATSTLLACDCPRLVAPAMNSRMWANPATQANLDCLRTFGYHIVDPDDGRLACGDVGSGKLASVDRIATAALALLKGSESGGDLAGRRLVVTAGPTHEAIDPVRYIANSSSGKMGFALARAAARRGAEVTLVAGPCDQPTPEGVTRVDVVSAADMLAAADAAFQTADAVICAAAVADYTPANPADHKLKKAHEHLETIELVETADILATLSAKKGDRVVVGFAAETDDLLANAQAKLARKGCDLIVANDVSRPDSTFGSDTNRVAFVTASGVDQLDTLPKDQVAGAVLDRVASLLQARK